MIEIREAWPGGPLRQFAKDRPNPGWGIPHASGGYAGSYVCRVCLKTAKGGVYTSSGVCESCHRESRAKSTPAYAITPILVEGENGVCG